MNTDLFAQTQSLTMSSREIAEVTGKDHRNVTRDIEKMLNDVGEGVLKFEQTYTNAQNGQSYREFLLPKDLTITLVAGYRSDLRLKIVRRWMELEAGGSPVAVSSAPQPKLAGVGRTFADMRRIAKLMKLDDAPIKGRRSRQMLLWSAGIISLVKQYIAQSATPYAAVTAAEDAVLVGKGASGE
ncbi:Rha family transcriptional regulator [Gluconobacter oxydans]|uniref:Uncharacterized protein n=1 Tax=Gluconobacter oxydans NBRC 3293 TaxID=1315969 RepID=A0A829WYP0_GLUOY|nr:Rha family transcriptional regulator [Gluconobacter oxydans]GEM17901.1 hypothetical protein NBRC3293_2398 [Gluconobacter oxydans NBRC 3293]